jgi:hypothetical protein
MKVKNAPRKLSLNKRTITNLRDIELDSIKGGKETTYGDSCGTCWKHCNSVISCLPTRCP